MPKDSRHVQPFHCLARTRIAAVLWYFLVSGQTDLVLGAGHCLVPGQGGDGVSHQLRAGGAAGQGGGVSARLAGITNIVSYYSTTISRKIIAFVAALKAVKVMICTFPSFKRHHAGGSEAINECLGS